MKKYFSKFSNKNKQVDHIHKKALIDTDNSLNYRFQDVTLKKSDEN